MPTIQVIVDKELLRLADKEAHRSKMNRSALIRVALRDYLRRLHNREKERRDREGYERFPENRDDAAVWEQVAAWPEE